jgi:hypothetical protein
MRIGADNASHMRTAMAKFVLTILMLYAGFGVIPVKAGFRSPESSVTDVESPHEDCRVKPGNDDG